MGARDGSERQKPEISLALVSRSDLTSCFCHLVRRSRSTSGCPPRESTSFLPSFTGIHRMRRLLSAVAVFVLPVALSAQTKPLLTPKDYGKWELLGASRFSPKGDWLAYGLNRVNEENELRLRGGSKDTTIGIAYGQAPVFSADDRWISYSIGVSPKERERLQAAKKPIHNSVGLRNLTTGEVTTVADVSSASFSSDGRFIAMTRYPAEGKKTSEVLVQDLSTGSRLTFGNVGESAWSEAGDLLALTIDTDGGAGNGVQVLDARTITVRVLESSTSQYRGLSWRSKATDLAVLRTQVTKEFKDTAHALLAFTGVGTESPASRTLDPATAAGFPAGTRIADYRRPSWSRDGRVVYFGVRKREPVADAIKKSDEKVSDVEIWHTNDVRMLMQQKAQEAQDLRTTLLTAWRADGKIIPIGTDLNERSEALEGGKFATEIDRKPYPWGWKFGRDDEDVWVTDLNTGARTKVLEKVRHYYGGDPTGTKLTWSDGKDFWVVDLASGKKTNMTASLTSAKKADFVDHEDDHPNNVPPVINPAGWDKSGMVYLVNDAYDVWAVNADGSGGRKLTDGAKDGVTTRLVSLAPFNAPAVERAYDLTKPLLVSFNAKHSKKSGYGRVANGQTERLAFGDAQYSALTKADSAPMYAYTRQRFDESPNIYLGSDIAGAKKVTDTNPFQKDYAWGKVELFDFKSSIGVPLQALLYYPANYDASKKYPMIVYTYELLTQGLHRYIAPRETDYYNANVFTQNGYFVLMPDIVFRPREPGLGTQQSVEPAIKAVLARGLVDPAKVGHVGHSQGGYESAFLATHSKMFATTVIGSGITDMWSFAGQLHWQGGSAEMDHWETGQFRMEVAPWEDIKAMNDNSPLVNVQNMTTKAVLMEIG